MTMSRYLASEEDASVGLVFSWSSIVSKLMCTKSQNLLNAVFYGLLKTLKSLNLRETPDTITSFMINIQICKLPAMMFIQVGDIHVSDIFYKYDSSAD